MSFLPQSKRERVRLYYVVLLLIYIGIEISFGFRYGLHRDTDFRAFRWDSRTLWRLKPDYQGEAFAKKIETNAQGFRGSVDTPKAKTHDLRIITLGDSRTYGFDVGNDETYSSVMERGLRESGVDAQVLNAGTHGYSAVQCRARLEGLLDYQPDMVVFAPGYNDRRYLISRPADSDESFRSIARTRQVMDVLQISHIVFGVMYEAGQSKLKQLIANPPPLDQVEVRVDEERFAEEIEKTAKICKRHGIQLMLLAVRSDPGTYSFIDETLRLHEAGETEQAIRRIEEAGNNLPNYSLAISRYYLGKMLESIGETDKARKVYADHIPNGSLFGESVLRLERYYFDRMRDAAQRHNAMFIDTKPAIVESLPEEAAEDVFANYFIDESHYNPDGHRRIGAALASAVLKSL